MKKNPIRSFKIAWSVITPMLLVVLLTSCFLFSFPFGGSTSTGKPNTEDTKGSFKFLDPQTEQPFSQRLTPPATVLVEFSFNGIFPVTSIEFGAYREDDEKTWIPTSRFANTRKVQSTFSSGNNAGTFVFEATVTDLYDRMYAYSEKIQVVDTSPPSVTQFDFYPSNAATLIPIEQNQGYVWMELVDEQSAVFSEEIVNSLANHTRSYLDGQDISNQLSFDPSKIFTTGGNNRVICIAEIEFGQMEKGTHLLQMFMGQLNGDEEDFLSFQTVISASFPDTKPPQISDVLLSPSEPGLDFIDYKIMDETVLFASVKDRAEKVFYEESGIDTLDWVIEGEGRSASGTLYAYGVVEKDFTATIRMRDLGFPDGIYTLSLRATDKNGNIERLDPIFLELGVTQSQELTILVEKISGNTNVLEYRVGDSLRFWIDTEWTFDADPTWRAIPEETLEPEQGLATVYQKVPNHDFDITVSAMHNGIPCFGYKHITVVSTPVNEDYIPPTISFLDASLSDPSVPFQLRIQDETSLPEEPIVSTSVMKYPVSGATDTAIPYGMVAIITPSGSPSTFAQEYNVFLLDPLHGGVPTLEDGEKIVFSVVAEDENENQTENSLMFY
ncbi:MAG TPA: hypothetical protein P5560_06750 [Thermotogota bacterium]|nr:hypothetical protein [Thermotogota bacterium]